MTNPEPHYDMDHVRGIFDGYVNSESLRCRYLKSWKRWLAWCREHDLTPGAARRPDVDRFITQLPGHSQAYVRGDISTVYFQIGEANPARRLRPITPGGREKHERQWDRWVSWCERDSASPLPADPDLLAVYLEEVARKKSRRHAERALSTISRRHSESDLPDPKRAAPVIQAAADLKALAYQPAKPRRTHPGRSPQTVRRDQGIWKRWSKWCAQQEIDPTSAQPEDVVAFLTERRQTCTYDYIRILYRSLRTTYQGNNSGHNPADAETVRAALQTLKQDCCPPAEGAGPAVPPEAEDDAGFPGEDDLQHLSPRTRKTYRSYWKYWSKWCAQQEIDPLDASPEQISIFLAEEAGRLEMKSVELYVPAIACVYDVAYPDRANPARAALVKQEMRGLKRKHPKPPAQMTGLTAEDFARIEATARRPQPWETERQALVRGTTDLAIIGIMRDGLLRVSEVAALTWDDLTEESDGSGRLYIAHSKTDQTGEGAVVFVSRQTMGWLRDMREMVMEEPTIFGIASGAIYTRIIDAAGYAGLEGRYGGHSARIGMTEDLSRANASLLMIMNAGRWKSPEMPALYIRNIAAGHNAVADWYERHPGRAIIR